MDKLPVGIPAVITRLRHSLPGLHPGTKVLIRYRSPDGGVVAMESGDTVIALQSRKLKGVRVSWQQK